MFMFVNMCLFVSANVGGLMCLPCVCVSEFFGLNFSRINTNLVRTRGPYGDQEVLKQNITSPRSKYLT